MNRVRIVALAAVGLGTAVVVGTNFQQLRTLDGMTTASPQQTAARVSLAPDTSPAPALAASRSAGSSDAPIPADAAKTGDGSVPLPLPSADAQQQSAPPTMATASVVPDISLPQPTPEAVASNAAANGVLRPADPAAPDFATMPGSTDTQAAAAVVPDPALQAELDNCAVWMVVTPAAAAMLDTSVYAPCDQGQRVTISHAGFSFDARIGADGQLLSLIPALDQNASVSVTFADGRVKTDATLVPDVASQQRVVLAWQGPAAMSLNAYENGAQYGDAGNINADHPLAPGVAGHGYLTGLGDASLVDGRRVQIYSYPVGQGARNATVRLEIEAPVTVASCGHPLDATAIEMRAGSERQTRALEIDMPACDGSGGYVVVPGVLPDLQIALN